MVSSSIGVEVRSSSARASSAGRKCPPNQRASRTARDGPAAGITSGCKTCGRAASSQSALVSASGLHQLGVEAELDDLRGAQHGARLVQRFLPFGFRHGIVDDPGAGLHVQHAVAHDGRADRDREIHVVLEADVADGARIDAARRVLELVDDLHRTDLRRAADRAGRKARGEHVEARRRPARACPRRSTRCASRANSARSPSAR